MTDIKEQMYKDKYNSYKTQLKRLEDGTLPEYNKRIKKLELAYKDACRAREVSRQLDLEKVR